MVMKCSTAFVLWSVSLLSFSCQNEDLDLQNGIVNSKVFVDENLTSNSFNLNVSEEEAVRTASSFLSDNSQLTRSSVQNISNVEALTNQQGDTLIYAVNFADNQGYVLVAATKKYTPILGYAEKGHFDATVKGLDIWLEDEMNMLTVCLNDTTETFNRQWGKYLHTGKLIVGKTMTQAESNFPQDLQWWWMEHANDLTSIDGGDDTGYENDIPAGVELVSSWCCTAEEAKNYLYYQDEIFSMMEQRCRNWGFQEDVSIYHIREFVSEDDIDPILTTNWHQNSPYNLGVGGQALGCVTVAVAQILNHHKKPAYFNWNLINIDKTVEQQSFFRTIGEQLGINYSSGDSGASIKDAERVLKGYGYDVTFADDCSFGQVCDNLNVDCPIFMRGVNAKDEGHAWVCDAYERHHYYYQLTVYAPFGCSSNSSGLFEEDPFVPQWDINQREESIYSFVHMNWGWGAKNNSWNRFGEYNATDGNVYKRDTQYLFVKP